MFVVAPRNGPTPSEEKKIHYFWWFMVHKPVPVSQKNLEDQERPQKPKNFLRYYKSQWRSLFDSQSLFLKEDSHYLPLCYVRIVAYKPLRSIEKLNSKFNRRPTSTLILYVTKPNPSDDDISII